MDPAELTTYGKPRNMLVYVFSQTFPLGDKSSDCGVWKTLESDRHGNMDVDAKELRSLFEGENKLFEAKFKYKCSLPWEGVNKEDVSKEDVNKADVSKEDVNKEDVSNEDVSKEDVRKCIGSIDKEAYDCFFFAFLTYTQPANTGAKESGNPIFNDERIHFNDTIEKGIVSFEKILDEVKNLKVAVGKPKIFLVQADDISYLEEKSYEKGPTPVPDVVKMKIPQDADRLIIRSTIPQNIASPGPSFLVQAFVEALRDNATKGKEQEDLLTLTTRVNAKVSSSIQKSEHFRKEDFSVPLTTSTLTKLLYL